MKWRSAEVMNWRSGEAISLCSRGPGFETCLKHLVHECFYCRWSLVLHRLSYGNDALDDDLSREAAALMRETKYLYGNTKCNEVNPRTFY